MAEIEIISVNCQGIGLLPKRTDVFNYLKEKSVIYTAYKTPTSLLELMKNWSDHVGIMIAILVLISQMQEASPSYLLKILNIKFITVYTE